MNGSPSWLIKNENRMHTIIVKQQTRQHSNIASTMVDSWKRKHDTKTYGNPSLLAKSCRAFATYQIKNNDKKKVNQNEVNFDRFGSLLKGGIDSTPRCCCPSNNVADLLLTKETNPSKIDAIQIRREI
jgi:hypothetical protein